MLKSTTLRMWIEALFITIVGYTFIIGVLTLAAQEGIK